MLTPIDIQKQDFAVKMRGYSADEVDDFLDMVGTDYENLYKENIDRMNRNIQKKCEYMERKTKEKCDAMIAEAQHLARIYMKEIGSDPNKR